MRKRKFDVAMKRLSARTADWEKTLAQAGKTIPPGAYTKPGSMKK